MTTTAQQAPLYFALLEVRGRLKADTFSSMEQAIACLLEEPECFAALQALGVDPDVLADKDVAEQVRKTGKLLAFGTGSEVLRQLYEALRQSNPGQAWRTPEDRAEVARLVSNVCAEDWGRRHVILSLRSDGFGLAFDSSNVAPSGGWGMQAPTADTLYHLQRILLRIPEIADHRRPNAEWPCARGTGERCGLDALAAFLGGGMMQRLTATRVGPGNDLVATFRMFGYRGPLGTIKASPDFVERRQGGPR